MESSLWGKISQSCVKKGLLLFLLIPLPYNTIFAIETPAIPAAHAPLMSSPPPHINWSGKRVLWLGTSIPHQGVGVDGYPEQFCQRMGCTVTNNAFSGSHIKWFEKDVDESCAQAWNTPKGLSATYRELSEKIQAALPDDGSSSYDLSGQKATNPIQMSYEYRINSFWKQAPYDVVVIDHGHNDRTITPKDRENALGTLAPTPVEVLSITKGLTTQIKLPRDHKLQVNDDITIRTPNIPQMDFWTGEIQQMNGDVATINLDSSHFKGHDLGHDYLVTYDKSKFFDAYNLIISDIYHMHARYGGNPPTIILMTPPTEWTGGRNDGSITDINTAIFRLAQQWHLPFFNLTADLNIQSQNLTDYLPDKVHPITTETRKTIADHIVAWAVQ